MAIRSIIAAVATASILGVVAPASAQQSKCLSSKTGCMSKLGTSLLKCEQVAETPGKPTDPNANGCVDKADGKFDGGIDPTKGCFTKLENKAGNDCLTFDDTPAVQASIQSCVTTLVSAIDPPPLDQTKCGAGKKKCVANYLKALLKCYANAQKPGKPTDPNTGGCIDKATAKFNGGVEPIKGCFEKLENKNPNDCQFTDDTASLQGLTVDCAAELVDQITPPPPTTTTAAPTTTTTTTGAPTTTTTNAPGAVLLGALPPTTGLFNFTPMQPGLPGADTRCNVEFPGTHHCTHAELLNAETAGDLVGLKDINGGTVTSFWRIDSTHANTVQCNLTAAGPPVRWQYATVHTGVGGERVALTNATGALGGTTSGLICFQQSWVGCCQ